MGDWVGYSVGTIDELEELIGKYNNLSLKGGVYTFPISKEDLQALQDGGILVTDMGTNGQHIHIFANFETREMVEKILTMRDKSTRNGVH